MWGLRPLFPVLKKMTDKIEASELLPLKREWIEIFESFAAPLVALDSDLVAKGRVCVSLLHVGARSGLMN